VLFRSKDELGFVVPHWIDNIPDGINSSLTNILLPINEENIPQLTKFESIKPTILLFLHNLRRIEIQNKIENKVEILKKENQNGKVILEDSIGKSYWKLVVYNLNVPENSNEKMRQISKTEIILAFPLKVDNTAKINKNEFLFAYLPIRKCGFRFIIHSDFLLTTNREDVDRDNSWNKWLRDNIADSFLHAIIQFKDDENLKTSFYKYFPVKDEITDQFLLPVIDKIYKKLQNENCILSDSGDWLKPSQVFAIRKKDVELRKLILSDEVNSIFGKHLVSAKIDLTDDIIEALNIQYFDFNLFVEYIGHEKFLLLKEDLWFLNLYEY
jgi:hypothetical protein